MTDASEANRTANMRRLLPHESFASRYAELRMYE